MRLCVNPYTGQLIDLDMIPEHPGGGRFCPLTGKPLDRAAVDRYSYPGPETDREKWAVDAYATVDALEAQANEPNHATLGVPGVDMDAVRAAASSAAHTAADAAVRDLFAEKKTT